MKKIKLNSNISPELRNRYFNTFRYFRQVINNPNNREGKSLRLRGIEPECDFDCFADFANWAYDKLGPPPSADSRIIRKNMQGPFSARNLEWGTAKISGDRSAGSLRVRYQGKTHSIKQHSERLGIEYWRAYSRYIAYPQDLKYVFEKV
jgi:hypothetical protein